MVIPVIAYHEIKLSFDIAVFIILPLVLCILAWLVNHKEK